MINKNTQRKNGRRILTFSACFLFAATLGVSCKKTPAKFGTDALSPEALMASGGIDTFSLVTYSVKEDSFPTDNQLHALVGSMHDPKMGVVNAAFYTQFTFNGDLTHDVGSVPIIDSVVLSLRYQGYYGKLTPQTFQVFEMTEAIDIDSTYYKNSPIATSSTDLVVPGTGLQTPNVSDSVFLADGTKLAAQLRLRLDNNWGYTMMDEAINGSAFENEDDFKAYFKGLKVKVQETNPSSGQGGILYFNLNSSNSRVTYYYRIQDDTTKYSFSIVVNDDCADFNQVSVDNTGYPVADVLNNHDYGQTQFYTQAFESRAKVEFPSVNDIPKNRLIHAAVLELPIAWQTGTLYYPSAAITVIIETDDYVAYGTAIYDETKKRYLLDVRSYIQSIVNGESQNAGLLINPSLPTGTAERIIFNGAGTSYKTKPRLIVKYTQF